jgi:predicted NodU family carbamoyl transferase
MLILGLTGGFATESRQLEPPLDAHSFHDAAACLVQDGSLLAGIEEERFTRIKKTNFFPLNAIRACLDTAGLSASRIDAVGYYFGEKESDAILNTIYVQNASMQTTYSRDFIISGLAEACGIEFPAGRLTHVPHHLAHAASGFIRSGFTEALVAVLDGGNGNDISTTIYAAEHGKLAELVTYPVAKSLGRLYLQGTQLIGYRFGDEYKVMGLAPYGDPATYRAAFKELYTLHDFGEYTIFPEPTLDPMLTSANLLAPKFLAHGLVPRRKGEPFARRHMDFAAALQEATEDIAMHVLRYWARATGMRNLCLSGGVAHNSTLCGAVLRSALFEQVYVHPVSHDAGAADGAALVTGQSLGGKVYPQPRLRSASLGPRLGSAGDIAETLRRWHPFVSFEQQADIVAATAEVIAAGHIVGWAQGRSEFGPRALGNRSILADPRPPENKDRINAAVKNRESFRPFAPVVTRAAASTYFEIPATRANYDFMSYIVPVRQERRAELGAVTHVDGTARIQVADPGAHPQLHRLVATFGELTGTPVLLNTSFNNNAEPIVQTVEDVLVTFLTTGLDYVAVGDFLVRRAARVQQELARLTLRFLPLTRLVERIGGEPERLCELRLDCSRGPAERISPEVFGLLRATQTQSGPRPLGDYGIAITEAMAAELLRLWSKRFFALAPPGVQR